MEAIAFVVHVDLDGRTKMKNTVKSNLHVQWFGLDKNMTYKYSVVWMWSKI